MSTNDNDSISQNSFKQRNELNINESQSSENQSTNLHTISDDMTLPKENACSLNPHASIFCPTANVKCVSRFNEFRKNLNLVYSNLQGMFEAGHFDEFKNAIAKSKHIDCIVIVESWLRRGVNQNKTCAIGGYNLFRSDRHARKNDHNKGGGVIVYVANGLKVKTIERSFNKRSGIYFS